MVLLLEAFMMLCQISLLCNKYALLTSDLGLMVILQYQEPAYFRIFVSQHHMSTLGLRV